MFQPSYFKQSDTRQMLAFIGEFPMASLVTMSSNGLLGNHIPMIVIAIAVALISTVGGLLFSYYADLASGATIVILSSIIFFILFIAAKFRK